jgi:heme/copper-type cytochrome/quinol oxidase subunit 3
MTKGEFNKSKTALKTTIGLGVVFSAFQGFEYASSPFCISDSAFGSRFFIATGFHGLHVIIGSTFLVISLIRIKNINIRKSHIIGFECAAWY